MAEVERALGGMMLLKAMILIVLAAEGADVKTTRDAFARGCVEANPLFGRNPSIGRIVALKIPATVTIAWGGAKLHKSGHKKAAIGLMAGAATATAAAAFQNTRCGR